MAKQHSSLTGVDLHDPKGIGAKNTTKVLHISQSVNKIDVSGSIIPTDNNAFQLGQSDKIFSRVHTNQITASGDISSSLSSTGSFGIIRVGGNNFDSAALGGGNFNTLTNVPSGIISGSGQLPNGIVSSSVLSSGAQGTITLTTNDVAANIDSGLQVGDSPTFAGLTSTGDVIVQGKLTAEVYAVSSSVTHMTRSFSSGSTIFGDTQNDTHQVTGSLIVTGSISATTFEGMISGSGQIASDISGSFNVSRLPAGTISGSGQLPSGIISGSSQLPSGIVSGSGQLDSTWVLGASGTDHYTFTGPGLTGAESDPPIYLTRGEQYRFKNKMGAHPFRIQSDHYGATGTAYNDGVTNNNVQDGVLVWNVQFDAPSVLFYQCTSHPNMGGPIYISNPNDYLPITGSGVISGSVLSSPSQGTVRLQTNGVNVDVDTGLQSADSPTFAGLTLTSHVTASGNISGSSTSTGSLGSLIVDGASIDFSNIPDSDPAVAGRVFRSGTDLKISTGGV